MAQIKLKIGLSKDERDGYQNEVLSNFATNEGTKEDTASSTGTRWAQFNYAQEEREKSFGTVSDAAQSDGSMWARFKSDLGTINDNASSDGTMWARYKAAEAARDSQANTYLITLSNYVDQANNTYQTLNATLCSRAEILSLRED